MKIIYSPLASDGTTALAAYIAQDNSGGERA